MLKKVVIENFECHKHKVLRFNSRVTYIMGPNDSGKSAIIRAIRWVCFNEPSGTSFITKGKKAASVKLVFSDGWVQRIRSKSKNAYVLNGKVLKAMGTKVPTPVISFLKLNRDNFQFQRDPPFWISESPSSRSKLLNSVIDLSVMDLSQKEMAAINRDNVSKLKTAIERKQQAKQELAELPYIRTDDLVKAKRQQRKQNVARNKMKKLVAIEKKWQQTSSQHSRLSKLSKGISAILDVAKRVHLYTEQMSELNKVSSRFNRSRIALNAIQSFKLSSRALERLNANKANVERLERIERNYLASLAEHKLCRRKRNETQIQICGKNCPLCGQKIITQLR